MFATTVPFSQLQSQRRWKVDFFCANKSAVRSAAYPLVPLREVLKERREFLDPQRHLEHVFNYLGLEHVESVTGDLVIDYACRNGQEVLSRSKIFRRGDLLYGRLRPSLNKVFVADAPISEGICSGEFYVLTPDASQVLPHFARALMASRCVRDVVKEMTTGSALPRLQLADLLKIEVPLPPLNVQRAIEAKLIAERERRGRLRFEILQGPSAMLDSLVRALESGEEFSVEPPPSYDEALCSPMALPTATATTNHGRGRPPHDLTAAVQTAS
jgi:hypothetical protein